MQDNLDEWVRVANDPIGTRDLWGNADKPWQFLAWCFEARGFAHEGESFVSRLPIALDGSCNGLQHFSAMLRDPIGGKATNLVDAATPADIYQAVADVCIAKLMLDPDPLAKRWLEFGIDRSLCKKPVMTMPYGSTRQACMQSVYACIMEKDKEFFEKAFKAAVFLTKFIWESIGEVVVAARTAMDWLRRAAGEVSKYNKPLIWTAPSGFRVRQFYSNSSVRRIETAIGGSSVVLNVADKPAGVSAYRMRNGASPNFVHSMDAAHLVLTVNAAQDRGIKDFACIHDDYGTHAADTPEFFRIIREEFVKMYESHNPLEELKESTLQHAGVELPDAPGYGTLDIKSVLTSKYFFG
jgi:DNA-directed RNA polymerase